MSTDETTAGHIQELRRGTVVLACLVRLRTPDYGYALLESLNALGILVDANTLYPLLRRLEKQGLLDERVEHRRGAAAQVLPHEPDRRATRRRTHHRLAPHRRRPRPTHHGRRER